MNSPARRAYRLLTGNEYREPVKLPNEHDYWPIFACVIIVVGVILFIIALQGCAAASNKIVVRQDAVAGFSLNQWCDAIKTAEGNNNYGILSVPCNKGADCRKVCRNTVRKTWGRFLRSKGLKKGNSSQLYAFVDFLGNRYCPVGAKNDPNGLNVNWKRNVLTILKRG